MKWIMLTEGAVLLALVAAWHIWEGRAYLL